MPNSNVIKLRPVRPCPICGKPSSQLHHPFCSTRCQDVDLNRWLSGGYVIPGPPVEDEDKPETGSSEDEE